MKFITVKTKDGAIRKLNVQLALEIRILDTYIRFDYADYGIEVHKIYTENWEEVKKEVENL